jgi:hypothetical protein
MSNVAHQGFRGIRRFRLTLQVRRQVGEISSSRRGGGLKGGAAQDLGGDPRTQATAMMERYAHLLLERMLKAMEMLPEMGEGLLR